MAGLIERLSKATGPSRELDAAIGAACAIVDDFDPESLIGPIYYQGDDQGRIRIYAGKIDPSVRHHKFTRNARLFTSSIDAALTLIPAGLYWMAGLGKCSEDEPLGACAIYRDGNVDTPIAQAEGATVPIAIGAAALKAREAP